MKTLIRAGAGINIRDREGRTPLDILPETPIDATRKTLQGAGGVQRNPAEMMESVYPGRLYGPGPGSMGIG